MLYSSSTPASAAASAPVNFPFSRDRQIARQRSGSWDPSSRELGVGADAVVNHVNLRRRDTSLSEFARDILRDREIASSAAVFPA